MEIIDNKLTVNMDVTDEIWRDVLEVIKGSKGINVVINGVQILSSMLELCQSISSISFNNCTFLQRTEVVGTKNIIDFTMNNCKRDFLLGGITLKKLHCRYFKFIEDKLDKENYDYSSHISPVIKKCFFYVCIIQSVLMPIFQSVGFSKKLILNSSSLEDDEVISFEKCAFFDYLTITLSDFIGLTINITDCKTDSQNDFITKSIKIQADRETVIKYLNINNSELSGMNLYLFNIPVKNVDINSSRVEILELYSGSEGECSPIYNLNIKNSFINKLQLNNRNIVHPFSFEGSKFNYPPEFFGSNIPHGSSFPKKNGFISRNGDKDASYYRTLRFFMESQRNRELEGMFFSLEQESVLNKNKGIRKYLTISYLYSLLSDYGTNYTRPLYILTLSILIFTILFSLISSPKVSLSLPIDWNLIVNSLIFSLKQVLQPFSALKDMTPILDKNEPLNSVYVFLGIVNSVLSIGCITLSGLAIRWKFKRG
ncbi:hypothetical protein [Vibrio furnissii]|uniref:hypothetical protein n=1 Tax=Vibrio furnissii TaxID=29494 RepID=UPI001EEC5696|nr:hypothetical protein [Vibrio furnissii]MCG6215620.1 hypothetical protein [Vibrio furnissii]